MNIGILGTGSVGSALARGFAAAGHDVVVGSRSPETATADLGARANDIRIRSQRAAADHGSVVVLALPASAVVDVAGDLAASLAGKSVVDAANEYPTATDERSIAERVADAAPDAHVAKAFNTIGAALMTDPVVDGETATMFVAGADPAALDAVEELASDLGFEPVVAGDLATARHLENLARFWIHLSREHGRDIAFRLLRE